MIKHPLAFGNLSNLAAVLYTVDTFQRIKLTTVRVTNLDVEGSAAIYAPIISIWNRGRTIDLTSNVPSLRAGFTIELIDAGANVIIDQGSVILGYNAFKDKVSFLIDGDENFTIESR